jgi:hypothetical protein
MSEGHRYPLVLYNESKHNILALVGKANKCTIYFFNVKEQETSLVHSRRVWIWWQETSDGSLHYKIVLKKILG